MTWWSSPDNALQPTDFQPGQFDIMGIVPVAYALFAVALGIGAGALLRRTLPALAVTLGGSSPSARRSPSGSARTT